MKAELSGKMDKTDKNCRPIVKICERLIQLETKFAADIENKDKALILARQIAEKDAKFIAEQIKHKFEGFNQFQHRMEKLENTFVTEKTLAAEKELVNTKIDGIKRAMNIGIGVMITIQFIVPIIMAVIIIISRR